MRRSLLLALAALALAGCPGETAQTGCPKTEGPTADAPSLPAWKQALQPKNDAWRKAKQTFIFNNGAEPETIDPHLMTGVLEGRLASALFEGLVTHHPKTLEPVPGVAESWTISADQRVYTFKLRPEAKWSDGRPLTAQDFYDSWKRALTPATACQYGYMFYNIKGAERFHKGKLQDFGEVGVKVIDAKTLEVTLAAPCAYFLDLVAFHTLLPVPKWVIEKHGDRWSRQENLVGNGAYVMKEWSPNDRIVLVKSPTYWDQEFVKLETIVALPHQDVETSYKLFQLAENDWMTAIPADKLDEIEEQAEYYVQPYLGSYFYRLNVTKPPFDDVRVRKALSMGFDRKIITRDLLRAGQIPATWFCPGMPGYEPPKGFGYDRDAARRLLTEAGFPGGQGFPAVALLYNTNEDHKKVAESIVQQWKENLGITVSLRNTEWKVYLSDIESLNYQIGRAGWIGDYADPNTFLDMWLKGGGNNNTGWANAEYDGLIAGAAGEADKAKRMGLLKAAETILIEKEFPIIPIYIYVNQGMLAKKVKGWHKNIRDLHPFKYMWIEPVS